MKSKHSHLKPASYQLVPLLKLLHNNLNSILISDGVGVGKTISAGYILLYLSSRLKQPALVVCPPSLLIKWKEELESKFGLRAFIATSDEELSTMQTEFSVKIKNKMVPIYIIPSSMLAKLRLSSQTKISVVVFDEIHNFRNKETFGFINAKEVSSHAQYRVGLSATPINNSLDDLISELSILFSNPSWDAVEMMIDDLWGTRKEIITNSMVTRFTKENLGIHFAKREIHSINVAYPYNYVNQIKDIISNIPSSKNSFFEKVTYYRLAASSSNAFTASVGLSEKIIDEDPKILELKKIIKKIKHDKWVIFCEFSETVKALVQELSSEWEIFTMTGDTPLFSRQQAIEDFRDSKKSLLIMTPVGSEGLDIQFCNAVINYDLHWNPMKIEQRIGRVDRVGQKSDKISVVNFIVQGSIDQKILEVIEKKLALISKSVFDLPSLIHQKNDNKIEMFDKKIFQSETEISEKFFTTLKNWETLPIEDYSILKKINQDLCDINELKKFSQSKTSNFFKNLKDFEKWKNKIKKTSKTIDERINFYS